MDASPSYVCVLPTRKLSDSGLRRPPRQTVHGRIRVKASAHARCVALVVVHAVCSMWPTTPPKRCWYATVRPL